METSHLRQAVPGIHLVDFPDVVFTGEDGEQARVGVVELSKDGGEKCRFTFVSSDRQGGVHILFWSPSVPR